MRLHTALHSPLLEDHIDIPKSALRFDRTWNVQRHCNAEWEFHFIRNGKCSVDIAQSQYQLTAGQALLIQPGLYHQASTLTAEFERLTLCFTVSAGQLYQQLSQKITGTPVFQPDDRICHTIDRLFEESNISRPYADAYTDALVRCLTVDLLRFLQVDTQQTESIQEITEIQLTQTIDNFFEQHFSEPCGEEMLAEQLHFSRRHLVRILKKHYGMTFREKLVCARMDYATFLLRTTNEPMSKISAEVGYESESAFFKVFRRSFGMTPRQYRTKYK